jgi:Xaa-Pro aminopeptidase
VNRCERARRALEAAGIDVALISPGPDLRYLVDYDAVPLERLTCLVLPRSGLSTSPVLVAPALEAPAARASVGDSVDIVTWQETEDPYALTARLCGSPRSVAVDDRMWAQKVLDLRAAMPGVEQVAAGRALRELRMRKDPAEVAALREAGAAIDRVHAEVPALLRPGRTEREVARDIAALILDVGHVHVDFVIVAAGPNGASPHHEPSDRHVLAGEPIVVDIGGTMPSGYCSDSTRMYCIGEPPADFAEYYAVLEAAQTAAVAAVRPGVACEEIDAVARRAIGAAGFGDFFVHRTGHGIGLETHEHPYMVAGNDLALEPGMAFSVEPGIYLPGLHGARIEDIVVCTDSGGAVMNERPRSLCVV